MSKINKSLPSLAFRHYLYMKKAAKIFKTMKKLKGQSQFLQEEKQASLL